VPVANDLVSALVRISQKESTAADAYIGHRDIGDVFGARGHVAGFFRHWKTYAASKERHDTNLRKDRLVTAVARHSGWRAALDLCDDKRIGPHFRRTALAALPLGS
jgi:hypothetical protein